MRFTHYVALGDSMSTDEYPTCDLLQLDAVSGELLPTGAAALFYRNRDDFWPEFAGTDLATLCPGIEARMLAWDGAMIEDVLTEEVSRIGRDTAGARILITLTAGGNDLLDALTEERRLAVVLEEISGRYAELVTTLREEFLGATLLLATVYDPTDGSGLLPSCPTATDGFRSSTCTGSTTTSVGSPAAPPAPGWSTSIAIFWGMGSAHHRRTGGTGRAASSSRRPEGPARSAGCGGGRWRASEGAAAPP